MTLKEYQNNFAGKDLSGSKKGYQARRIFLQEHIFDQRILGLSFRNIAKNLKIPPTTCHDYWKKERDNRMAVNSEKAELLRTVQLAQLEKVLETYMKAFENDPSKVFEYSDKVNRVHDRIAKLMGLDAPQKAEVKTETEEIITVSINAN